jgi:hypothetical protein
VTVFQLLIYSCVTITAPISGDLVQKSCAWQPQGGLWAMQDQCEASAPKIGSSIFSDVADGRVVERTRCAPQAVQ